MPAPLPGVGVGVGVGSVAAGGAVRRGGRPPRAAPLTDDDPRTCRGPANNSQLPAAEGGSCADSISNDLRRPRDEIGFSLQPRAVGANEMGALVHSGALLPVLSRLILTIMQTIRCMLQSAATPTLIIPAVLYNHMHGQSLRYVTR